MISIVSLLYRAGWAPLVVLVLHAVVAETPYRKPLDFWMHFSGGVAIAYFLSHALRSFEKFLGVATLFGHHLFAFALACTVGMFWEFGELFSDVFLGTHIQKTIHETMSDLIADTLGAITSLTLICIVQLRKLEKPR